MEIVFDEDNRSYFEVHTVVAVPNSVLAACELGYKMGMGLSPGEPISEE